MSALRKARRPRRAAVVLLLVGLVALAAPAAAQPKPAQACNPAYGCTTTTTTTPPASAKCAMSIHSGPHGTTITIGCDGVAPGSLVRVLWNGQVVATGQMLAGLAGIVPASAGRAQAFDAVTAAGPAAQAALESHLDYAAPDLTPGTYNVVIAGDTFSVPVGTFTLTGQSNTSTGSSLAHTGITVLLWLIVALAVVAVGYLLSRANQRRNQH